MTKSRMYVCNVCNRYMTWKNWLTVNNVPVKHFRCATEEERLSNMREALEKMSAYMKARKIT